LGKTQPPEIQFPIAPLPQSGKNAEISHFAAMQRFWTQKQGLRIGAG
jgi:hypothetical protein